MSWREQFGMPRLAMGRAYRETYKQLYQLFPDIATDEAEERNRVFTTMSFLEGFAGSAEVAYEVGAGRCLLARALAKQFKRVIAFDVAPLTDAANWPSNLQHAVLDGMHIDVRSPNWQTSSLATTYSNTSTLTTPCQSFGKWCVSSNRAATLRF